MPWLSEREIVILWTADGRSVIVSSDALIPSRVERVDLDSGRRTLFKEIAPPDRVGLMSVGLSSFAQDERSYAYGFTRQLSTMFVVESKK